MRLLRVCPECGGVGFRDSARCSWCQQRAGRSPRGRSFQSFALRLLLLLGLLLSLLAVRHVADTTAGGIALLAGCLTLGGVGYVALLLWERRTCRG